MYDVDESVPPGELKTNNNVDIPQSTIVLSDWEREILQTTIDPKEEEGPEVKWPCDSGINIYLRVLGLLSHFHLSEENSNESN